MTTGDEMMLNLVSTLPAPKKLSHWKHVKNRKQRILERRKLKKKILKFGKESNRNYEEKMTKKGNGMSRKEDKELKSYNKPKENSEKEKSVPNEDNVESKIDGVENSPQTPNSDRKKVFKKSANKKNTSNISKPRSSLFSGNPEIPELEELTEQKTEVKSNETFAENSMFQNLDIHRGLRTYVTEKMELKLMTEVQSKSLPMLLQGKDALIRSPTGSGKTLAYALALVQSLASITPEINRSSGPMAVILVPTRELALQSYELFHRLTLPLRRIVATCVIGGQKRKSEKARIRKGTNIIISTPGRFVDHLQNTTCLSLAALKWLVFDEADRLLDMGFQKDINAVLETIKEQATERQQVVLLSATLNKGVENLVALTLTDPVRIEVTKKTETKSKADVFVNPSTGLNVDKVPLPDNLSQHVALVPSKQRLIALLAFVNEKCNKTEKSKLIVFVSCRDAVIFHCELFKDYMPSLNDDNEKVVDVFQLHGGMAQNERNSTISEYKRSKSAVLFCTDVAARGLDIPKIEWVVQYTSPGSPVDYIHRVGRTARAGNAGNALLFLTPVESPYVKLLKSFDIDISELKVEDILCGLLDKKSKKQQFHIRMQFAKETASEVQQELEELIKTNKSLKEHCGNAFVAFIRAYATYPSALKYIFHVKNLHLGHVAKSFALQDTPTEALTDLRKTVGDRAITMMMKRKKKKPESDSKTTKTTELTTGDETKIEPEPEKVIKPKKRAVKRHPIVAKFDLMSEFSSGMGSPVPIKKQRL